MEEATPVKVSVAELAGKFKSHPLPMPGNSERKPVQRSPPCSVQLHDQMDCESDKEKPTITPQPPPKTKLKNSPLIEKLQANPILSPNILLNSAKSPEGKQQAVPFCPISPQSLTLRPSQQQGANEVPISFEQPAEGTTLPSFNKSRVRLSFKRRPPTRQRRKSADEEGGPDTPEENRSSCDLHSPDDTPDKNGNTKDALNVAQEETHESQEDSAPSITVQDTELQEEHNDVTKDIEGTEDTEGENKDKEQVAEEKSSGDPEASEAVDNQQEKKALEEHSVEEMEGSKTEEETSGQSTEENMDAEDQDQDQASAD
ncbi:capZ-interacting protein isoform X1 [Neoarius graeffei]|uniref:capZ-interacting protein isoform X1 n=1 Tax=Neoarius graeffei TaxID=443677 RepID=UPI00298C971B|nr:capZ-interacting protein isoform X1 [Neoarius graeffei]